MTPFSDNSLHSQGRNERRGRWLVFALVGMMVILMAAGSMLPPHYKAVLHTHGRFHSLLHVAAFGVLAFMAMGSTLSSRGRLLTFAGCLVFGTLIEIVEWLTFHGAFEWHDVVADALGITFASLVAVLFVDASREEIL